MALKLATLKSGGRDGTLVVVSQDLTRTVRVPEIAPTLQYALERWHEVSGPLRSVYRLLNGGAVAGAKAFRAETCASPLPRAYQWLDGSAYVNHVELVRRARGIDMPEHFWVDPLMYQGGSDTFLGPCDPIPAGDDTWGVDFEAELAVITDDVPMGTPVEDAGKHIRLLMLVNDVTLRALVQDELAKGFGFLHSKPPTAFSPVAVEPDTLGAAWDGGRLHLPLATSLNGNRVGIPNAGADMTFDFPRLIAHAAKTRPLEAGTIIGSGTVSNKQNTDHGYTIEEGGVGYACLAEQRMVETLRHGTPRTPFLRLGDTVRIEMFDTRGESVFGAIEQAVG